MMQRKKFFRDSNLDWIWNKHFADFERFKWRYIHYISHDNFEYDVVYNHSAEFKRILEDWILPNHKKIQILLNSFLDGYRLMLVSGARGSGKTAFGFWLVEQIHFLFPNRRIIYVGVKLKEGLLPKWIENMDMFDYEKKVKADLLFNYIVLLDEMAISFNARKWQSEENIEFSQLLTISRHKHLSVIAIAQDFTMVETNAWKLRDMVLYKKSNTYELSDRDSKGVGSRQSKIQKYFKYIKQWMKPKLKEDALFEYQANGVLILFKHLTSDFWTQELSEGFSNMNIFEKKSEEIQARPQNSYSNKKRVDEY